jgi:hypothetical protein
VALTYCLVPSPEMYILGLVFDPDWTSHVLVFQSIVAAITLEMQRLLAMSGPSSSPPPSHFHKLLLQWKPKFVLTSGNILAGFRNDVFTVLNGYSIHD